MKKLIVSIGLCALLVLSSCGLSPEKALQEAVQSGEWTLTDDRIIMNETRIDDTEHGKCSFSVSMDVQLPSVPEKVPVYLIELNDFSADFLEKTTDYLMTGDLYNGQRSKQDIEQEILDASNDFITHTIMPVYQDQADDWLEALNKQYEEANLGNGEAYKFNDKENIKVLHLKSYPDYENSIMDFYADSDTFYFRIDEFNKSYRALENKIGENIEAKGTQTTYEQALKIADNAMAALFDVPFVMAQSRITDKINHLEYLWNDADEETSLGQSYAFYYNRDYDGIPSLLIDSVSAPVMDTDAIKFPETYPQEYTLIVVDDRGIALMNHYSFSETIEKLDEDTELMPIGDILNSFLDSAAYHALRNISAQIKIARIDFGLVREPVSGNPRQYRMVPAWNFVGHLNGFEEDGDSSILTINALDGSVLTSYDSILPPK